MARRRYRCSWDDIAWLDANYMAGWGAFDGGRRQTIDFDDDGLPKLAFEMEDDRDAFTVFYQWKQTSKADNGDPNPIAGISRPATLPFRGTPCILHLPFVWPARPSPSGFSRGFALWALRPRDLEEPTGTAPATPDTSRE